MGFKVSMWGVALAIVLSMVGCAPLLNNNGDGTSLLTRARMLPNSVTLEVISVRSPFGSEDLEAMWQDVDEQSVPSELRRRLNENGFRVGLISGTLPLTLARLMEKDQASLQAKEEYVEGGFNSFQQEPKVLQSLIQSHAGQRKEILASGFYAQMAPLIIDEEHQLGGKVYREASGVLAVKTTPLADGRVRLDVTPELQYGEVRQKWMPLDGGSFRIDSSREKEVFHQLRCTATLAIGEMMVLSSWRGRSGSLGHYYFTAEGESGTLDQKLYVIRMSRMEHSKMSFDQGERPGTSPPAGAPPSGAVPATMPGIGIPNAEELLGPTQPKSVPDSPRT